MVGSRQSSRKSNASATGAKKRKRKEEEQEDISNVTLEPFDIKKCFTTDAGYWRHPFGIIYGFRRTGKTTNMVSLLFETKDEYGSAYRFSPTADNVSDEDGSTVYGIIFPRCFCWDVPAKGQLKSISKFQKYLKRVKIPGLRPRDRNCVCVLDDLSSDANVSMSPELLTFACNCRNDNITLYFLIQYFNQAPRAVRGNCDFFMTNWERDETTKKKLRKEVFSMIPTDEAFEDCMKCVTEGYGALVWVNMGASKVRMEDCVFWYRATHRVGDFRLNLRIPNIIERALGKTEEQMQAELENQVQAHMRALEETEQVEIDRLTETKKASEHLQNQRKIATEMLEERKAAKNKKGSSSNKRKRDEEEGDADVSDGEEEDDEVEDIEDESSDEEMETEGNHLELYDVSADAGRSKRKKAGVDTPGVTTRSNSRKAEVKKKAKKNPEPPPARAPRGRGRGKDRTTFNFARARSGSAKAA